MGATTVRRLALLASLAAMAVIVGGVMGGAADAKQIKRCNKQRVLCDQPFDEIVLAGAHNAMSSAADGWVLPNQSVAIPEQLEAGIRGFLIDTHYGRKRDDGVVITDDDGTVSPDVGPRGTYLCHEICQAGASPLAPSLREIRKFLREHPNNVLLIEVEDHISADDFAAAVEKSGLSDFIYHGSTDTWPTLREMIASKEQVVFLSDNHGGTVPWYHPTYAGILQETPYNFDKPSELTNAKNWRKSCGPNRGDVTGSLFLMNHWSPPTPPPEPDVEQSEHVNARAVIYNRALECQKVRGRLPSIIATDQSTIGGLFAAVKDLNGLAVADPGLTR